MRSHYYHIENQAGVVQSPTTIGDKAGAQPQHHLLQKLCYCRIPHWLPPWLEGRGGKWHRKWKITGFSREEEMERGHGKEGQVPPLHSEPAVRRGLTYPDRITEETRLSVPPPCPRVVSAGPTDQRPCSSSLHHVLLSGSLKVETWFGFPSFLAIQDLQPTLSCVPWIGVLLSWHRQGMSRC